MSPSTRAQGPLHLRGMCTRARRLSRAPHQQLLGFRAFIFGANRGRLNIGLREQCAAGLRHPLSPRRAAAGGDGDGEAHRDPDPGSEGGLNVFTTTCVNELNGENYEDVF